MRLKRYAVTVMDNWTPWRSFWTLRGARRWRDSFPVTSHIHLFRWNAQPGAIRGKQSALMQHKH